MSFPLVGIDYDEPNPLTYRGVEFRLNDKKYRMETGHPSTDMVAVWLVLGALGWESNMERSSVNHFGMDGGDLVEVDRITDEIMWRGKLVARHWMTQHKELKA